MSNGQNNPNQGNQKGGRDDQKHSQKQRDQLAKDQQVNEETKQPASGAKPASGNLAGKTKV